VVFKIRDAGPRDQVHIIDCDIKCFDMAWSIDNWTFVLANHVIKLATFYRTPVGFAVLAFDNESRVLHVPKLGVKPTYRRRGVGRQLMQEAINFAQQTCARHLETVVPESILRPGEPAYVGDWLLKVGWKATGIVKGVFTSMGEKEDGVKFIWRG
jgi:ribosomal protein S18 acetylase RimI-like enzyme